MKIQKKKRKQRMRKGKCWMAKQKLDSKMTVLGKCYQREYVVNNSSEEFEWADILWQWTIVLL